MGHDQRFKELLRLFLKPFLEIFFPHVAQHLDLSSPEFLDKELFEDPPEGSHRVADLVARVASREGDPELVLVHIEVQSDRKHDVPARRFDYFSLLHRRYRLPIVPLVIYLRGGGRGLLRETYKVRLFGRETLRFQYDCLILAKLDARATVARQEALVAALAALMDRSRVSDRIGLRLSMLDRIGKSRYDPYRKFLLTNLVEVYFELRDNEVERFERALSRPEFKEAREMATSHVERIEEAAREKGREEGRSEGVLIAKRETLVRQLTRKFGVPPSELDARVRSITAVEELDALLDRVLEASTLEEMNFPG